MTSRRAATSSSSSHLVVPLTSGGHTSESLRVVEQIYKAICDALASDHPAAKVRWSPTRRGLTLEVYSRFGIELVARVVTQHLEGHTSVSNFEVSDDVVAYTRIFEVSVRAAKPGENKSSCLGAQPEVVAGAATARFLWAVLFVGALTVFLCTGVPLLQ